LFNIAASTVLLILLPFSIIFMSMSRSSSLISGEKDDGCIIGSETAEVDPASRAVDFSAGIMLNATDGSSSPIAPKFN
jgi:hypothetical protein